MVHEAFPSFPTKKKKKKKIGYQHVSIIYCHIPALSFLQCSDNPKFVIFLEALSCGSGGRIWLSLNLASATIALSLWMAPTVTKNGATVTMSSGKSFDHQLALAL